MNVETIWTELQTEQPSLQYDKLDISSSLEIVSMMNQADVDVPKAVSQVLPKVATAVDAIVDRLKAGGRLFYVGAGTSGRLGILDAAECPPTFNASPEQVQAIIAGGYEAIFHAVEEAEDSELRGEQDLAAKQVATNDVVVGITASGRTPYVAGALQYAQKAGAFTVSVTCNANSVVSQFADVPIEVVTGQEVLMGSTRLKAGTAQKLVLNMLSTASMVKLGKAYRNLMVDLRATNHKLVERSKRIIMFATGASYEEAAQRLGEADGHVKLAILMHSRNLPKADAVRLLDKAEGVLRVALHAK